MISDLGTSMDPRLTRKHSRSISISAIGAMIGLSTVIMRWAAVLILSTSSVSTGRLVLRVLLSIVTITAVALAWPPLPSAIQSDVHASLPTRLVALADLA